MLGDLHEARVAILDGLARLAGFTEHVYQALPEGGRPDVLRRHPGCSSIFIGEAKATEGPERLDTQARLSAYLRFFAAVVKAGAPAPVFAVCIGEDPVRWRDVIWKLGFAVDLDLALDVTALPDALVVWARLAR